LKALALFVVVITGAMPLLANYRGYDTLGETTVIFTAGMAVMLLLRRRET